MNIVLEETSDVSGNGKKSLWRGLDGSGLVSSVQKKFRDSFVGATLDPTKWHDPVLGGNGSISVSGGALTLGSGAVANSESYVMTRDTFTIPFRVQVGMTMPSRTSGTSFYLEAVSVDPATGIPDGLHSVAWLFDGVVATQGKYLVQNGGLAALVSAASTISGTATGSFYELEPFADEAWFHSSVLDSTNGRQNSYRRHQQIPDPNALYKLRLRWKNASSGVVSSSAVIQFVSIQDYAELTAEITAGRGQTVAGQALGVALTSPLPAGTAALGSVTLNAGSNLVGNVGGAAAHDAAVSGNPLRIAGRAQSAAYTTVASGDTADLVSTLQGVQVTRPWQIPELEWSYAAAAGGVINTTDVILAAAAGAGLRRYITALTLSNPSAVATEVVLKDGTTVIWRGHLPANAVNVPVTFQNPLKTTANTALNFACITTGAAVYVNAQGFTAA